MHKILVHAQDSCACTRVLCMHKSVVHAQESCACTRILTFLTCSVWRILQKVKLFVYPLNLAGNPSPVAQKGTRSKYRAATILKSPLPNMFFLIWQNLAQLHIGYCPGVGLLVPIGPSKGSLLARVRDPYSGQGSWAGPSRIEEYNSKNSIIEIQE